MNPSKYFNKIEAYYFDTLSGEERQQFKKELSANPELEKELQVYQLSHRTIGRIVDQSFRIEMESWWKEAKETGKPTMKVRRLPGRWKTVAAAAAVVILLGGWFVFQWAGNAYSNEQMAAQYFEETFIQVVPRSTETTNNPLWQGKKALQEERFQDASLLFREIQTQDPFFNEAEFYLGYALYRQADYGASAEAFEMVAESGDPRFSQEAEWYQTLALLAAGKSETTFLPLFERILADEEHEFNGLAKELESDLNSFWRKLAN